MEHNHMTKGFSFSLPNDEEGRGIQIRLESLPSRQRSAWIRDAIRQKMINDDRNVRILERVIKAIEDLPCSECPNSDVTENLSDEVTNNLKGLGL